MTIGELMRKRLLIAASSLVFLLLALVSCVFAVETFNVPNLQNITRAIELEDGDSVAGNFTVSGGSGDVNFYVKDPNGTEIIRFDRTTGVSFSFSATKTGTYTLNFDNRFSLLTSKTVILDYSVKSAVLGIPQDTLLLLLGVAALVVGAVVITALVRKPRRI